MWYSQVRGAGQMRGPRSRAEAVHSVQAAPLFCTPLWVWFISCHGNGDIRLVVLENIHLSPLLDLRALSGHSSGCSLKLLWLNSSGWSGGRRKTLEGKEMTMWLTFSKNQWLSEDDWHLEFLGKGKTLSTPEVHLKLRRKLSEHNSAAKFRKLLI